VSNRRFIRIGAEASLHEIPGSGSLKGKRVVEKTRLPKRYRNEELDRRLSNERMKTEAKLMAEVRTLGIPVPIIYDVNPNERKLFLEFIEGITAKEALNSDYGEKDALCVEIGRHLGTLHRNDVVHGDLTTSNMILSGERLYLIDLSMGAKTREVEDKGVDLHLLAEAFKSSHPESPDLFDRAMDGYREVYPDAEEVLRKMAEIEKRGRYT
jgi:N6-L-threonylcarbamoyladenine synthase/protein kinase Bud32